MTTTSDQPPDLGERVRFAVAQRIVRAGIGVRALRGDPGARLFGRTGRHDPYPHYRDLRAQGPLVRSATGWTTASHDVVDRVLRDPQRFVSAGRRREQEPGPVERMLGAAILDPERAVAGRTAAPRPLGPDSLIGSDPPDHTRLRRLVSRAFTPRAVASWRPRVEQLAADLLDEALPRGGGVVDLVPTFAAPLPVLVICELLGVPSRDREQFQRWGDDLALGLDLLTPHTRQRVVRALDGLAAYFDELFARRRREPGTEVIDTLLAAEAEEPGLSSRELMATSLLLLAAGFETTVNLIGNAASALLDHPDQLALLRADPGRIPGAVEEVLRFDAPVQRDVRHAAVDVEVAGQRLRRGTTVSLLLGGANRDPAVFADPDRFDVTRSDAGRHLAFAAGIHYCLGAALARIEGEVAIRALLDRAPRLERAGPEVLRPGLVLRGRASLPVRVGA